jgi:hypothetical protein
MLRSDGDVVHVHGDTGGTISLSEPLRMATVRSRTGWVRTAWVKSRTDTARS